MRLLYIITRADTLAGAQVHVMEMAQAVIKAGHEAHVLVGLGTPYGEALQLRGIPHTQLEGLRRNISPLKDVTSLFQIRRVIRKVQPDLISTHSSKAGILGRVAARTCGVPCLFTAHGWSFTEGVPEPRRSLYRFIERLMAPLAARIICVSEADRRFAMHAGIAESRLVTIHNGRHDLPKVERDAAPDSRPVRIVMIGRLDEQKDHALLFSALEGLDGFELDLIGDGPRQDELQRLAVERGLGGYVRFLGLRTDVPEQLARADLFCLITNWEGFPRSTLEAMRAGLPVIVSDAGGSAAAVDQGQTGFVVPRGDQQALHEKLEQLLEDPGLRHRMGEAGRRRFEALFTFERMYTKTIEIYYGVLQPRLGAA